MNFTQAREKLQRHGNRHGRPRIGNNTWLERAPAETTLWGEVLVQDAISIVYHATPVATLYADGSVKLNTGGFRTMSTKDRMNLVKGIRVEGTVVSGWTGLTRGVYANGARRRRTANEVADTWYVVPQEAVDKILAARERAGETNLNYWDVSPQARIPFEDGMVIKDGVRVA